MRTLDAALTTAQQAASRAPYLRIHFDDRDGTTVTYTTRDGTNRIVSIRQWEEGYAGVTVIRLRNHDQALSAVNYQGYSVSIGWGMVLDSTPDSTWYSNVAVMKVLKQRDISYEGELVTEFYCVSIWAEIATDYIWEGGKKLTGTLAGTFQIGELVTGAPSTATGRLSIVAGLSGANSYIVVTRVTGTFAANDTCTGGTSGATLTGIASPSDNFGDLVYASGETNTEVRIESLTGLTVDVDEDDPDGSMADTPKLEVAIGTSVRAVIRRMLLRTKCGMRFENDGRMHVLYLDTTDAAQYEFQSTHAFFEDIRDRAIILPNTVYFVDKLPDADGAATYIGTANDNTSVTAIGTFVAPIQVDPDIESNAEGNTRAAAWIAHKVAEAYQGRITAPMECGLEVYDMVQAVDARLNVTSKGRIGRIERIYEPQQGIYQVIMTLGSLYSEPGAMDVNSDSPLSDLIDLVSNLDKHPPEVALPVFVWQLPEAIQGYQHDLVFSATDLDTVAWAQGTITFYDGSTQAIAAGNTGDMADTDPRYVYFDLDDASPNVLKVATVDTYISTHMSIRTGVVCLVKKSSASGINAMFLPSYGKEPLITTDVIHMAGLLEHDFGSSTKLQAILATQISAGQLKLTSATVKDSEWYNESGVEIDATHGINIYGVANAFTTRATKTGTIQCYVGADGKIYAGAGNVILSSDGIDIKSENVRFYYGAVLKGYMGTMSADILRVLSNVGLGLYGAGGDAILQAGVLNDGTYDLQLIGGKDVLITPGTANRSKIARMDTTPVDQTASRALNTTYTNSGTKPLFVVVSLDMSTNDGVTLAIHASADPPTTLVSGIINFNAAQMRQTISGIVPVGWKYRLLETGVAQIALWHEVEVG